MEGDFIHINDWLLPLSWLYGLGVGVRNLLFDLGVLRSRSYDVPVISVGNVTVGGTGKTPHVEYLIQLLHSRCRVAVLSRGYKRKSRGYLLAAADTPMRMIGDEPYQMKQKYPDISVAVDRKRTRGIERLTSDAATCDTDVILLDDAFQHRYVRPGINILLVDYHRLIIYDKLLPAGRLREPQNAKNRADIVIVTKCPRSLRPMEYRVLTKAMSLFPYQRLFFTTFAYDQPRPLFDAQPLSLGDLLARNHLFMVTGIGSPRHMEDDIRQMAAELHPGQTAEQVVTHISFADHHNFSRRDIDRINNAFDSLPEGAVAITTEKDAARLLCCQSLSQRLRHHLYVLPIRVQFMLDQEEKFNENIIGYVRKNSRNSILAQSKDDHSSRDRHNPGNGSRTISFRDN